MMTHVQTKATFDLNDQGMSFAESLKALRQEKGKLPQPPKPTMLPLKEIKFAHTVLQPRSFEGNRGDSEDHIRTLQLAIRNKADHLLDPVVVWWTGKRWVVLDGHHRMVAYQRLARDRKAPLAVPQIPVEVFEGSLEEAICEATKRNAKDKLNMTKAEKLERAWKLVVMDYPNPPSMSRSEIAKATGIAERTVSNMRSELSQMVAQEPPKNPLDFTWDDVKGSAREPKDIDEAWLDKQAKEFAKRMAKTFGTKLARNPTLAAKTIEFYSETLPMKLVECWPEEAAEVAEVAANEDF